MDINRRFFALPTVLTALLIVSGVLWTIASAWAQDFAETRIRAGHQLKITVSGHPEFSQVIIVRSDGTTDYPLLAGIPLDGLTAADVRDLLIPTLLRFESEPEVFVNISDTRVITFQVQGAVLNPNRFTAETPINVQQAVVMAGGATEDADFRSVKVLRLEGGERRTFNVDLQSLYREDSLALAPPVEDLDIILVTRRAREQMIHIFGAVNRPGSYLPLPNWNIADAIQTAGGIAPGGNENSVTLISQRNEGQLRRKIQLDRELANGNYFQLPAVAAGDIIIVAERGIWNSLDFWARFLSSLALVLSSIVIISRL